MIRLLVVLLVLVGCADLMAPPVVQRPRALIDCIESPEDPACSDVVTYPPVTSPPINLSLGLLADIPLTIDFFASAPGADRITATSRFWYGPGWKDSTHAVDGSNLSVHRVLDPMPLRVDWRVTAWLDGVVVDTDSMRVNLQ